MATIYHAVVQPNGKIEIDVPELAPGQSVTITVAPEASATNGEAEIVAKGDVNGESESEQTMTADDWFERMRGKHVLDIVAMLPGHQLFKTVEEVDAYIREERDSWGD